MTPDAVNAVTYAEVGATRYDELPSGYRNLRHRARLGTGTGVFTAAADAVFTWRMHRAVGLRPRSSSPRAVTGATVTSRVGPLAVPCVVVWDATDGTCRGFGYGTLPGHPFTGEEAFVVSLEDRAEVWFTMTSFSRPVSWYARAAGRVAPLFQRWFARRCAAALRRLAVSAGPD